MAIEVRKHFTEVILYLFLEVRYRISKKKKSVVKTLLNIFLPVKTEWQMCGHPKCFSTILKPQVLKDKKIVVHSKQFFKIIGILLLIARFVKSSDQNTIQTIKKINQF